MTEATETTLAGEKFIREPLKNCNKHTEISLPGIGPRNSKKLKEVGIVNEAQLLGQYVAFNMDNEMLINYLVVEAGVIFVSNKHGKAEDYAKKLCDTLKAKYELISEY